MQVIIRAVERLRLDMVQQIYTSPWAWKESRKVHDIARRKSSCLVLEFRVYFSRAYCFTDECWVRENWIRGKERYRKNVSMSLGLNLCFVITLWCIKIDILTVWNEPGAPEWYWQPDFHLHNLLTCLPVSAIGNVLLWLSRVPLCKANRETRSSP